MTDPNTADSTYIEPIHWQYVAKIIENERPDAILPTLGGQTGLNTGHGTVPPGHSRKIQLRDDWGRADVMRKAEDRQLFKEAMQKIGLDVCRSRIVNSMEEARDVLKEIGLPIIIRASFTLGGMGGGIAYNREEFEEKVRKGIELSPINEVLLEESIIGWKEYEMK